MNTKNLIQSAQNRFFKPTSTLSLPLTHKNFGGRRREGKPTTTLFSEQGREERAFWFLQDSQMNDNNAVIKSSFPKAIFVASLVLFLGTLTLAGMSIASGDISLPEDHVMDSMMDHQPEELAFMLNSLQVGE